MKGFFGQYNVNLDPKGRIALPARIRPRTESGASVELALTKGLDGCLAIYTDEEWTSFQNRLDELSFTNRDLRSFSRHFYSLACIVEPDRQGRFLIPANLLEEAGLKKEVLIIGANRWIEIWNPESYRKYMSQLEVSYEDVAERLLSRVRGQEG